jgi:hypothetical protein
VSVQGLLAIKFAHDAASGAVCGTVDCEIKISFGVFHDYVGQTRKQHLELTALVLAAARTVDIGQTHNYLPDVIVSPREGKTQPPLGITAQRMGKGKTLCLYVNLHRVLRSKFIPELSLTNIWADAKNKIVDYLWKKLRILRSIEKPRANCRQRRRWRNPRRTGLMTNPLCRSTMAARALPVPSHNPGLFFQWLFQGHAVGARNLAKLD